MGTRNSGFHGDEQSKETVGQVGSGNRNRWRRNQERSWELGGVRERAGAGEEERTNNVAVQSAGAR